MSLRTKSLSTAKVVAALVNSAFATSILFVKNKRITRAEAQVFLAEVVSMELKRIEEERYFEPQESSPEAWRQRNLAERTRAIAIERVAAMGRAAALFDEDRATLLDQGYSKTDFEQVESSIAECIADSQSPEFQEATSELAQRVLPTSALSSLPKPTLEKRPNKPKQLRPSKNRETQRKSKAKREAQLDAWKRPAQRWQRATMP